MRTWKLSPAGLVDDRCFTIERFRALYPAYNDLDDDVLLQEVRRKLASRTRERRRLTGVRPT